jgi:hypothetical protein
VFFETFVIMHVVCEKINLSKVLFVLIFQFEFDFWVIQFRVIYTGKEHWKFETLGTCCKLRREASVVVWRNVNCTLLETTGLFIYFFILFWKKEIRDLNPLALHMHVAHQPGMAFCTVFDQML